MAIYRGDGGAGDATTDITINAVTAKATEAATSATNAANSATSASTSASNAATSETNAANSATSAGTSATSASTSATNASTSASTASTAATDAQTAQTAAETAETNAETAETNAAGSATAAASSATSAASSATTATTKASEAAASASAAATSASAASTSASNASTSATNAATSETNAGNSATAAASSASSASTSASTATTKASEASTSATNAATSATNAASSATAAGTSETNAASSASSASTSASTATTQASNAATSASNASTSATNASNSASAASTSATNASNSASAASTSETNAGNSATAAAASAVTAASYTPSQTGNSGKYLTTNGSVTSWGTVASGDVVDDTTPQLGGNLDLNSKSITGTGNINITGGMVLDSAGYANIELGGASGAYIDLKAPSSDDYDGRIITTGTGLNITSGSGGITLSHQNSAKIATTATGVDVTGTVTSDSLTVDTNTLHVDATNNRVGIGTASPSQPLHVVGGAVRFQNTQDTYFQINTTDTHLYTAGSHPLRFGTNSAERMRIDSGGNIFVGKTADNYATTGIKLGNNGRMQVSSAVSDDNVALDKDVAGNLMYFSVSTANVGTIYTNGSSTSYNTASDYRLKDNVNYSFDATTRLKQLKPCRFNFITDVNTTVDGFLAHEVSQVVPEAVTGTKDATKQQDIINEDGEVIGTETVPDYQGIDQAKLVPLLVATIQELEARITALEAGNGS